ncbi:MAG: biotin transporter BioY [Oscillospiraceae bacterium]|nr:biotin transporter BioY [Oscillospiraceae bacterium]
MKLKTIDLTLCGIFAAVLAICSWIQIPGAVPFTLQTFGVFAALGLLGGKRGTISIGVFLLLGAIGLPVFAGFKGGVGALFGATGGYLLGFLLSGLCVWFAETRFGDSLPVFIASMIVGLLLCYAFGTVWFIAIYTRANGAISIGKALMLCVIPFLPFDAVKLALAVAVRQTLRRYVPA